MWARISQLLMALCVLLALNACSSIYYQQQLAQQIESIPPQNTDAKTKADSNSAAPKNVSPQPVKSRRKLIIFFDGTRNNVEANTNVKRLHSLVSLQSQSEIATLYIEGVGVGRDILGAGAGVGFQPRVVLAYNFLRNNYHKDDQVYIFGFSRGAYQARALTSMLQYVGLPDAPPSPGTAELFSTQIANANSLFTDMKRGFYERRYPCEIAKVREPFGKEGAFKSRRVHVLGLWDSVEALGGGVSGWPDRFLDKAHINSFRVDIDNANVRYGDQLRNVDNVFQAMSLDDDREWIFTPLLVTRLHLLSNKRLPNAREHMAKLRYDCQPAEAPDVDFSNVTLEEPQHGLTPYIQEVWFSGAHSDVGGGYDGTDLPGVSLNWMLEMLSDVENKDKNPVKLFPKDSRVREDIYGTSHDPEGDSSFLYHYRNRNIAAYALGENATCSLAADTEKCGSAGIHEPLPEFAGKLLVHESVFKRRNAMAPRSHENQYLDLRKPGTVCVKLLDRDRLSNPPILVQSGTEKPDFTNSTCPTGTTPLVIEKWSSRLPINISKTEAF